MSAPSFVGLWDDKDPTNTWSNLQLLRHEVMLVSGRMILEHSKDPISEFFVEGPRICSLRCRLPPDHWPSLCAGDQARKASL